MKTVEIENASRAVTELRKQTKSLPIRVTDHGKLVAYLFPAAIYDEEDMGYMTDPAFWKMIRQRRNSRAKMVSLDTIKRELEHSGAKAKPNGKIKHAPKGS